MIADQHSSRLTPWVVRLLALNAVVLLLQETLFTSDAITEWLRFDPRHAFDRPWTFVTYMGLHGGFIHLLGNSIALFVFGPPVERRLGSSSFVLYYIYCGMGAAVLSLLLESFLPIAPFIGASGAVLGVALAFARFFPEAEIVLFPIPVPIKAKWLVVLFAMLAVFGAAGAGSGAIAHVAHLGGLLFGWLFFVVQRMARGDESPRLPPMRPQVVRVPAGHRDEPTPRAEHGREAPRATPAPRIPDPGELEAAEIDRVLDKISATGIASLTSEEKAFLARVSQRRKDGGVQGKG
jgi:membrane associated rhomboid family serine protease